MARSPVYTMHKYIKGEWLPSLTCRVKEPADIAGVSRNHESLPVDRHRTNLKLAAEKGIPLRYLRPDLGKNKADTMHQQVFTGRDSSSEREAMIGSRSLSGVTRERIASPVLELKSAISPPAHPM